MRIMLYWSIAYLSMKLGELCYRIWRWAVEKLYPDIKFDYELWFSGFSHTCKPRDYKIGVHMLQQKKDAEVVE